MGVAVLSPKHFHQQPRSRVFSAPHTKPRRGGDFNTPKSNRSTPRRNRESTPPLLSLPIAAAKHQQQQQQQQQATEPKVHRAKSPDFTEAPRILKRGESLTPPSPQTSQITVAAATRSASSVNAHTKNSFSLNSTPAGGGLLGSKPNPGSVPHGVQLYAGSGFFISPPPSSVPVPAFARKALDVAADLRRILQLE